MNLVNKTFILNNEILEIKKKFQNCTSNNIKRGDYLQISFLISETKKKGGSNSKLNKITGILLSKKLRYNNISITIKTLYKNEKVKWSL